MLNCFRLYSITWLAVIIMYDLGWSTYCTPLNIHLRLFIYNSIVLGFILGALFNRRMKFRRLNKEMNIGFTGTFFIVGLQCLEYVYCHQIPLISVVFTKSNYTDFPGIPTLHVVIYTIATFYAQYLFYGYLNEKRTRYLFNYLLIVFTVYGLQYMRGGMIICFAMSFLMWLSSVKLNFKIILISSIFVIVGLYCFGGAGNIRSGYSWNDTSAFFRFGGINEKYPDWLPTQYAWTYSYTVGCLATLNRNVTLGFNDPDKLHFIQSIIPDFLMRRIWPDENLASARLIWRGFTTTTGYFHAYYYGRILGVYIMYFILISIAVFICMTRIIKPQFKVVAFSNLSIIMALYFFTNALAVSAIGFTLVYPIVISLMIFRSKYSLRSVWLSDCMKKLSQ